MDHQDCSLDDWYHRLRKIYLNVNYYRLPHSIFMHLVEVMGGLSCLASHKSKPGVDPDRYIPKALAWWMALCATLHVRSVEALVWAKFPGVCPYCLHKPHVADVCEEAKKASDHAPDWDRLAEVGKEGFSSRPKTLGQWVTMFGDIYPPIQRPDQVFGRLAEELGELAESVRVFQLKPGYFFSEAADVFAWLMHLQHSVHRDNGVARAERGKVFSDVFYNEYPDKCRDCGHEVCTCPPILRKTFGRIAKEMPPANSAVGNILPLLTNGEILEVFDLVENLRIGEREEPVTGEMLKDFRELKARFDEFIAKSEIRMETNTLAVSETLSKISELASSQIVNSDSMDALARSIAALSEEKRSKFTEFFRDFSTSAAGSAWVAALLELINKLVQG